MSKKGSNISRRKVLKGAAASLGASVVPWTGFAQNAPKKKDGLIEAENRKPGTHEWQLQYTSFDTPATMASYPMVRYLRSVSIEGYVTKTSLMPGESLDFKVSMRDPGKFRIDVYRMGYYGGTGARICAVPLQQR